MLKIITHEGITKRYVRNSLKAYLEGEDNCSLNYYLFGIDEDLNGRMFEAFLAAIMRGKALGQYFTPRSIVKLMVRLADLKATPRKDGIERVLDACCGTGGFLIEALTVMRRQIWSNGSLPS